MHFKANIFEEGDIFLLCFLKSSVRTSKESVKRAVTPDSDFEAKCWKKVFLSDMKLYAKVKLACTDN